MAEGGRSDDERYPIPESSEDSEDDDLWRDVELGLRIDGNLYDVDDEELIREYEERMRLDAELMRQVDDYSSSEKRQRRRDEQNYGPYAYDLYRKALEDGIEEDSSIRVNVVGNFGQGKTSLVNRLIRKDIDSIQSTNGIDIAHYKCQRDTYGNITYKENPGLDPSDIAKRIKTVSRQVEKKKAKRDETFDETFVGRIPLKPTDMSEEEKNQLIQVIKSANEQDSFNDNTKIYDIWDFGGQYIFYATHTLFHSRKAIYLLVFNLSCGLNDVVPNDDEEDECCTNWSKRTMEYYIRFWVNSIHSFVGTKDGTEPKIILVGTHFDNLKGDDRSKRRQANRYFDNVRAIFKGKQSLHHIYHHDFPVDNKDVKDETFVKLNDTIFHVGQEFSRSNKVPAKWIQLEKSLFTYREKKIVEFAKIVEIDNRNEYRLGSSEQIKLFLKHQHDQGALFFFDEEPVSKYVVLDPQFLIDAFKCLITANRFIANMSDVWNAWQTLKTEGKLETSLIDKLWTNADDKLIMTHRETILWFLQKHRILSEALRFDENEQVAVGLGWFIVPSLLKDHSQESEIGDFLMGKSQTAIQFVMSFDNSAVVPTVYHRLIAAVLGKWSILEFREKKLLFENLSIIRIDLKHAGVIRLNDRHIQLSLLNLCPPSNVKRVVADEFRRFAESVIMYEFRKFQGVTENTELPYTQAYACNHESHGVSGSKNIRTFGTEFSIQSIPCPDVESHKIDTDLARSEWYQGNAALELVSSEDVSDQTLGRVSQVIGEDWQILGQALGLGRVETEHIRADNHSTAMRIYKMLLHWRDTFPETASIGTLVEKLRSLPNLTVDWDGIRNIIDELNKSKPSR